MNNFKYQMMAGENVFSCWVLNLYFMCIRSIEKRKKIEVSTIVYIGTAIKGPEYNE